jgi:hypothetical protein
MEAFSGDAARVEDAVLKWTNIQIENANNNKPYLEKVLTMVQEAADRKII